MEKFGIYAWPAFRNKNLNPYNYLIYTPIAAQEYPVYEFYLNTKWKKQLFKRVVSSGYKVFHMHWPSHNILKAKNTAEAWERFICFYAIIKLMKIRGKKIFWTVHNLQNHEGNFPRLQRYIENVLYSNVDGFITMNKQGLELIKRRVKDPKKQRVAYIPHPHYKTYYLNNISQKEAREKIGVSNYDFIFLFIGQIRQYKNVPALIKAFKELNTKNTALVIAGSVYKDMSASALKELIGDAGNIKLYDYLIEDNDMQVFLNAADLVVNPYMGVFNSGSVLLNLSFNKPTLAPELYALTELKDLFGERWIKLYKGELTSGIMEQAMKHVIDDNAEYTELDAHILDPETIAAKTVNFYKSFF